MRLSPLLILPAMLLLGGCFAPRGLLYTRIREPLMLPPERQGAPVADKQCHVSLTQLKEPVTRINLSVMWSQRVVQEELERAGMSEVYYCDLETLSVLLNSYVRRRIVFYGN